MSDSVAVKRIVQIETNVGAVLKRPSRFSPDWLSRSALDSFRCFWFDLPLAGVAGRSPRACALDIPPKATLLPEGGAARRVGETQGVAPRFAPLLGGTAWLK